MKTIRSTDLEGMEKLARVQFATSLPGAKPVALIGTINSGGATNLAPFSSIVHLGSNPALLGMITRPDVVERHTLANILATRHWTINHLHPAIMEAAHQCSARYPENHSEFDAVSLTPHFEPDCPAPYVQESRYRIGLSLEETLRIEANNTQLIVGRVHTVQLPAHCLHPDGSIDLEALGLVASTALDTYFTLQFAARYGYAKPDRPLESLSNNKDNPAA